MNANDKAIEFQNKFRELLNETMRDNPPIQIMISCMAEAEFELRTVLLSLRQDAAARDITGKIIPIGDIKLPARN